MAKEKRANGQVDEQSTVRGAYAHKRGGFDGIKTGKEYGGKKRIMERKDQGERENGGVKTGRIQRLPQVLGAVFYLHCAPGVLPAVLSLKPFRQ